MRDIIETGKFCERSTAVNKTNVKRLLHTVLTFMIMNLVQHSLLLLFQNAGIPFLNGDVLSLTAFLAASGAAVLTFRQKTYSSDSDTETPPLVKMTAGMCVMQITVSCAVMVALMYAVSLLINGNEAPAGFTFLSVVSILVIHPVIEEIIFRKMFYGELRLMSRVFGCIAQTLMFAILHSTIDGMIYALCSGLVLAILYERTGRLLPCIAAHIFINLRSLLSLTVLAEMTTVIHTLDFVLITAGIVCFAVSAAVTYSGKQQEDGEHA